MSRSRMGLRHKKRRIRKKAFICLLIMAALLAAFFGMIKTRVEPNLGEIGRMRANVMISQIVNKALNEHFSSQTNAENLLMRKSNEEGQMEILEANTNEMNLLVTEISLELQKQYAQRPEDIYSVPVGVLMGSRFLSQTQPAVDIRIKPTSVTSTDFKTEFISEGINQTKYKVYIEINSQVKVLAPFASDTFEVSTTVLISEAIILGNVPGSYVNVPKEEILDVAP